jgi:cation diffusion facilitator family transporter
VASNTKVAAIESKAYADASLGRKLAMVSVVVGVALAVSKIAVGLHAGSTAVLSDGFEAAGDVLSSAIVYAGLSLATKPPDAEHPYGHGRYETLAGLAVGGLLLLTGTAILAYAIATFGSPRHVQAYAFYPLAAAAVLKITLAGTKLKIGRRIRSSGLQADAWHDVTDLVSTGVAASALMLTLVAPERFGTADQVGGIIIGLIILFLSLQVVRHTVDSLLDTMPEPEKMETIRSVALQVPGAAGIEKCFARRTGLAYHVDLHLEVDPEMTVRESHAIAQRVRNEIKRSIPWVADVLVHVEPAERYARAATSPSIAPHI